MLAIVLATTEPSKVAFFIGGGVLAAWAVVLATLGLRNPTFPGGAGGQRAVIALSLALAAAAMVLAVATS
jgi:hypothetical protein